MNGSDILTVPIQSHEIIQIYKLQNVHIKQKTNRIFYLLASTKLKDTDRQRKQFTANCKESDV